MRRGRIRAWQAWLAIAGVAVHLLAMVALAQSTHADGTIVDPATGQRLVISICTGEGLADEPTSDAPAGPQAEHRHECVLCTVHGAAVPSYAEAPTVALAVSTPLWKPTDSAASPGRIVLSGLPRGPPLLV